MLLRVVRYVREFPRDIPKIRNLSGILCFKYYSYVSMFHKTYVIKNIIIFEYYFSSLHIGTYIKNVNRYIVSNFIIDCIKFN